jgi:hypothetical protein
MGGFLDKPITEKKTSTASNEHLRFTSCEMQGWLVPGITSIGDMELDISPVCVKLRIK